MGTIDYEILTRIGSRVERTWSGANDRCSGDLARSRRHPAASS